MPERPATYSARRYAEYLRRKAANAMGRYRRLRRRGLCASCMGVARRGMGRCGACAERKRRYGMQYRKAAKERGRCARCNHRKAVAGKSLCKACFKVNRIRQRRIRLRMGKRQRAALRAAHDAWWLRTKLAAFDAYGGRRCACCGESNLGFLTIDHVHNDGAKHRVAGKYRSIYPLLKKLGFPRGYRVMCYNCNCGRARNGGVCPHKKPVNGGACRT